MRRQLGNFRGNGECRNHVVNPSELRLLHYTQKLRHRVRCLIFNAYTLLTCASCRAFQRRVHVTRSCSGTKVRWQSAYVVHCSLSRWATAIVASRRLNFSPPPLPYTICTGHNPVRLQCLSKHAAHPKSSPSQQRIPLLSPLNAVLQGGRTTLEVGEPRAQPWVR